MEPASISRRLRAIGYDILIFSSIMIVAAMLLTIVLQFIVTDGDYKNLGVTGRILYYLYFILVFSGSFSWFLVRGQQTLGMRAWRIRIVSVNGNRITWAQAMVRSLMICLTLGIGMLTIFADSEHQSFYDRFSGTRLVMADKDYTPA